MDITNPIDRPPRSLQSPAEPDASNLTAVRALAEQFESLLLAQMLREMRESMAPENDDSGDDLGGSMLTDAFTSELGLSLSRSGGVGLADYLVQSVSRGATQPATDPMATAPMAADPRSPDIPAVGLAESVTARAAGSLVNSTFGWRTDPLQGQPKFHAGQDLRAAYGDEVRAAAGGVVTFAGERGGYGLMVVVDHGGGTESRYAHLSVAEVQPGMVVQAGQAIARSGNSGRSTGPHLHFEVRQHGLPIDPGSVTGLTPVTDIPGLDSH